MKALPYFDVNADTTLQMDEFKEGTWSLFNPEVVYKKGINISVAVPLSHVTPMDLEDNIKLPIIAVNMITT